MSYGLKKEDLDQIKEIFNRYPQIEEVILYGSRAMGTYKNGSDVDLTVRGKNFTLESLLQLSNELDETYLPYTFDISLYDHIKNPDLLDHIHKNGVIFFRKNES